MQTYRLRSEGVACSDLGDEVVILDLESSTYFSAAESAAVLVGALVEGATRDDLVGRLTASYDVAAESAAADVEVFLEQLRARNLLQVEPGPPSC